MARFARPVRVGVALVVLCVSGPAWFILALYSGLHMMGGRSHPLVDLFGWLALATALAAVLVLCLEFIHVLLDWSTRRGR